MRNVKVFGMAAAALLVSVALHSQAARAQTSVVAPSYKTSFVRAMDECFAMNAITVVNPGSVDACHEMHVTTDTPTGWTKAKLSVRASGRVGGTPTLRLQGSGFKNGAPTKVGLQLTVRTTNSVGAPTGSKTYQDETIICGNIAGTGCGHYFTPRSSGSLSASQSLSDCLTGDVLTTTLSTGNIEVLDAALINCDTGKVFAIPGVAQK